MAADILNTDTGTCYCCGGTATDWVESKSSAGKHSIVYLCREHFTLFRQTMWGWLQKGKHERKADSNAGSGTSSGS